MITGDENIVEAQMIVQYRITDPSKFLFRLKDPEGTLRDLIVTEPGVGYRVREPDAKSQT